MNRTIRLLLIVTLAAFVGSMSAQTIVTFDATEDKGTRTTENPGEDMITKDGVTVTISNGCMALDNHYRCYAGADFTVSSTGDKILKVEITCAAKGEAKYGPGCLTEPSEGAYEFEADGHVGTWTGNNAAFSLTATKQVRITKVEVTVGEAPEAPTLTLPEGQYFEAKTVSFEHEQGCTVLYTLNGEDPTYTDGTHYTGTLWDGSPLNIAQTTTVKAIAVSGDGKSSAVAAATYTIVCIQGDVTFEAKTDKGSRTSTDPGEDMITKDGFTIAVSNGCMGLDNHYRCYAGAGMTFTSIGNKIVKVEITCTAKGDEKYGPGSLSDPSEGIYEFDTDGNVGTWIGNAESFTLNATKQTRITKVVVTYSDTPVMPVFSINEGIYFGAQKMTMSCGAENFIIYTTNGDEPAYTDESHYTGTKYDGAELDITKTTTVKAIAVSSIGKSSSPATATISIVKTEGEGTAEKPFTVDDSRKVIDELITEGLTPPFYTKGYVVSEVTTENGEAEFWIGATPGATTNLMNVYKAKGLDNTKYKEGDVKIGDEVVIYAQMELFAGDYETYHGYIYSINGQTEPTGIQTIAAEKMEKGTIYNIKGEKQNAALNALPHGLYIVNGKTVAK